MRELTENYLKHVMTGDAHGFAPASLRAILSAAEPIYRTVVSARNTLYDRGLLAQHRLGRAVISVGNITTGGTGKTPIVRWLAVQLRDKGLHPAILMRGYKSADGKSDEQMMLHRHLNVGQANPIVVAAGADRVVTAGEVLRQYPQVDVFLLDDAFQHRRVLRDFNLVLINAADPFGGKHVLPRGLLRESLHGLRRADAILLTRADQISAAQCDALEAELRKYAMVPIYRASHLIDGFRDADDAVHRTELLREEKVIAVAGIGDPASFTRQLQHLGAELVGVHALGDHHRYTTGEVDWLRREADLKSADVIVTTEKDWMKLEPLIETLAGMRIWRASLSISFRGDDGVRLLGQVQKVVDQRKDDAVVKRLVQSPG